jgi:hypothetical protein
MPTSQELPDVHMRVDLDRHDGQPVAVVGHYAAVARPRKGPPDPEAPRDHATVQLAVGTRVYLEPIDGATATRSLEERVRCEGKHVRVTGVARRVMPAAGAGLLAPCIEHVRSVEVIE